jgi:hypothetical protein
MEIRVLGIICQNCEGLFMGLAACVFLSVTHPLILETMACREAISQASDLNILNISIGFNIIRERYMTSLGI